MIFTLARNEFLHTKGSFSKVSFIALFQNFHHNNRKVRNSHSVGFLKSNCWWNLTKTSHNNKMWDNWHAGVLPKSNYIKTSIPWLQSFTVFHQNIKVLEAEFHCNVLCSGEIPRNKLPQFWLFIIMVSKNKLQCQCYHGIMLMILRNNIFQNTSMQQLKE